MSTTATPTETVQLTTNEIGQGVQPDIQYHPEYSKYLARTARRLAETPDLPKAPLPAGFPDKVEGPIVWKGEDWTNENQWVYRLSDAELQEIDNAIQHFKGK